ncbi:MAG: ATPase [Rhodospirillales bacterium]|nr:ATPase [Rhodospirillales bacterium]
MRQTKRLYKAVSVVEQPGGFVVFLDLRQAKTPAGAPLCLPNRALAQGIADEWDAQGERVDHASMPLFRLVVSAVDRIGEDRPGIVDKIAAYAGSDLLCYWADGPAELTKRQAAIWQPVLDWVAETYNACFTVTSGVIPVEQPPESVRRIREAIEELDDFSLAALSSATATCGSVLLGLALVAGRIAPDQASEAAQLDERFQAEKWGDDPEAAERRQALDAEILAVRRFVDLLGD